MPELPDILLYVEALQERLVGRTLVNVPVRSPSLLRTYEPKLTEAHGKRMTGVSRIGKRLVIELEDELALVVHLMIAGRFHWKKAGTRPTARNDLAAFMLEDGTLMLTEASMKKRAQLHVIRGQEARLAFTRGGIDALTCGLEGFSAALARENHTLKRSLTDPRLFDGIGNAYSDEILHAAKLSPLLWTRRLTPEQAARLHVATRETLLWWIERLRAERKGKFPEKVTAFRPEMAVHGKFGQPCPVCATPVQRIKYADNETNYCPTCQTEGKLLADRSLSRLLKGDWPSSLDELEELKERQRAMLPPAPAGD